MNANKIQKSAVYQHLLEGQSRQEDGTMSGLNAAHKVLTEEGREMNAREIYPCLF